MKEKVTSLGKFYRIYVGTWGVVSLVSLAALLGNRDNTEKVWQLTSSKLNSDLISKIESPNLQVPFKDDLMNFLMLGDDYFLGGDGWLKVQYENMHGQIEIDKMKFGGANEKADYFDFIRSVYKNLNPNGIYGDVQYEIDKFKKDENGRLTIAMIKSQVHFTPSANGNLVLFDLSVIGPDGDRSGINMSVSKDQEAINLLRSSNNTTSKDTWTYLRRSDGAYLDKLRPFVPLSLISYADDRIKEALIKRMIDGLVNKD